jgi:hypothetical protein
MKKGLKRALKRVKTPNELFEVLGVDGFDDAEISYRGGHLGFYRERVAEWLDIPEEYLPKKIGAFCNYLGGGIRGAICVSTYSEKIKGRKREILDELLEAIRRCYLYYENEMGLNDEEVEGEINWEAEATKWARAQGITSAY